MTRNPVLDSPMDALRLTRLRAALQSASSAGTRAIVHGYQLTHSSLRLILEVEEATAELLLLECKELQFVPRWTPVALSFEALEDDFVLSDSGANFRVRCRAILVVPEDGEAEGAEE